MSRHVPELSLREFTHGRENERIHFADQLYAGLQEFGFIILKDHGLDPNLLDAAYDMSEKFFRLSESAKLTYVREGGQTGYTPFGKEHAKDSRFPDLKEFWHVARDGNLWPTELASFSSVFTQLYRALDDSGRTLLKALTMPLELDCDHFTRMTDRGSSVLRILHYPPVPAGADPGCVRAAAHEDINLITLLVTASASGLELLTRDGKWLPVETDRGNIIVDSGDMLARITNDVIPATTHRVVNPVGPNISRYSMPFFMHPNPDAVLSCLPSCRGSGAKYPPILADDFLMERLREIGLLPS